MFNIYLGSETIKYKKSTLYRFKVMSFSLSILRLV